jgi:hypothetical protein
MAPCLPLLLDSLMAPAATTAAAGAAGAAVKEHECCCVTLLPLQNVTLVAASSAAAHEAAFFGVPQQSLEEAGGRVRAMATTVLPACCTVHAVQHMSKHVRSSQHIGMMRATAL